jgi:chemotaxis protein methyltransferase CheR
MHLPRSTFEELRQLIHRLCGLVLAEEKAYLVRHRLEPLARASGCRDFEEFCRRLRDPGGAALYDSIIEAITTSETSFFRDRHPFEAFRQFFLPRVRAASPFPSGPRLRIWCAAVSTGQEPYSLAMLVRDAGLDERHVSILATDISARVLEVAAAGAYSEREVTRGLTPGQIARHFRQEEDRWLVQEPLRRLVEFRRFNILNPLVGLGRFDAIFCRNVLIYFDEGTRRRVCQQCYDALGDDGWLVLGAAENLYGIDDRFESVCLNESLVYRKVASPKRR